MKKHLKLHPVENSYKCALCGKSFISWNDIHGHMQRHAGDNQYRCSLCGQELISRNYLKWHMIIHTIENSYKCAFCGDGIISRKHPKRRMKGHAMDIQLWYRYQQTENIMGIPCYTKMGTHNYLLLVELVLKYLWSTNFVKYGIKMSFLSPDNINQLNIILNIL